MNNIFLVNNDILFHNSQITRVILEILENNPSISILGPRIQVYGDKFVNQGLFHKFFFSYFYPYYFISTESYREIGSVMGCFLALRTSEITNEVLFDESFFMYGEEHNLCFQAWSENKRVAQVVREDCIIYHKGGDNPYDTKKSWKFYLSMRNSILCGRNFNYSLRTIYILLCFFSCIKLMFCMTYPVQCKCAAFKGFIKGCLLLNNKNTEVILADAKKEIVFS